MSKIYIPNEEISEQIAESNALTYAENDGGLCTMNSYPECLDTAMQMAEWKDKQWEERIREFLHRTFYVHPHDCGHICTDDFDTDGELDTFVDEFIERINHPEQWQD